MVDPRLVPSVFSAWLAPALLVVAACSNSDATMSAPDAGSSSCDPATVLPSNYRLIAATSTGLVTVATSNGVTSGTIDATAGGVTAAAGNPYIYVDLRAGTKVAITDLAARTSADWDIALKRSSLRVNGGDSGAGGRSLAVLPAATLAEVTAGPADGYAIDDFTTAGCTLDSLPAGEPKTAFGEWYDYDDTTHAVTPKAEVYVIERGDGSRTALRIDAYAGDPSMPTRTAFYRAEWKQLPSK